MAPGENASRMQYCRKNDPDYPPPFNFAKRGSFLPGDEIGRVRREIKQRRAV
jgi:hypothetical protein